MWMGFGSTVAKKAGTYDSSLWNPSMNRTTIHCPLHFFNTTVPEPSTPFEPFTHLELYEVSYIWYSAIAWAWCVIVGVLISLTKPEDHRRLDRKLISPALPKLFAIWPKFVKSWIKDLYEEIGTEYRESAKTNEDGALNMGYVNEKFSHKF